VAVAVLEQSVRPISQWLAWCLRRLCEPFSQYLLVLRLGMLLSVLRFELLP
jgi:hypothetical protein